MKQSSISPSMHPHNQQQKTNSGDSIQTGVINRFHKDRLFKALFGSEERKDLTLELYNAINHTSYSNPDDLQINTIEDVVYMGMKNDVSFLLASDLNMYEQQSTWNPNMPLRCLLYSAHALEKYIHDSNLTAQMFLSTLVKVPTPKLVVLYNGIQEIDDMILRLSDCFEKPGGDLEATVHVYNITAGHRLPRECRPLEEYSLFVDTYRSKVSAVGPGQAADEALSALPDGRVKDYLCSQRSEVVDMLLTEYDEQAVMQAIAKDAEAKGEARGEKRGEKRGIEIGEARGEKRGIEIGEARGEKRGENRGEEKLGLLITAMMKAGESTEALARVSTDPAHREAMYRQYGITNAALPNEPAANQ